MRIVYIITRADAVGGASIHVRDLARAMRDRGHEALVVVGGTGPVTEQFAAAGVPFRSVKFLRRAIHPVSDLRAFGEVTSVLRELRPGLVSTHTAKAGWIGRAACARLGLPAIYTPHGLSVGARIHPRLGPLFTAAERMAAQWTAAIICVSEAEREAGLAAGLPGDLLRLVPNGVRDIPAGLRASPGNSPARICAPARFAPPKVHATLLSALARIRSQAWELDLVGDGPGEPALRSQAESLGIGGRVHFLGYLPDPACALAAAQLFVLSSRSEALPRSVLEAMRGGLPVIATDVGGVREAVAHGSTGLLAPPGDTEALAAALSRLIGDPALRLRMGAAGRHAYEERFRLECMLEKTESIYANVLGGNPESRNAL